MSASVISCFLLLQVSKMSISVFTGTQYYCFAATLTSTPNVTACPDDIVTFTCTLSGSVLAWDITPPQGQGNIFRIGLSASSTEGTSGNPAFRGVLTDSSGPLTATLTSLSEASIVEGTMVECLGESSREGPLIIAVAGEFILLLKNIY